MSLADVGGAIGSLFGPLGAVVGSLIGGLIDQQLLDDLEGPRMDDLAVTFSTYGAPIARVYGPENRIGGNIIWFSGINETKQVKKTGLFGLGPKQTTYFYKTSVAVALNRRPSNRIIRIWADRKVIFDATAGRVSPDAPFPELSQIFGQTFVKEFDSTGEDEEYNFVFDESIYEPAEGGSGIGFEGTNTYIQQLNAYRARWFPTGYFSHMQEVTFYPGSATQGPDPTMEAVEGVGNVPAYRHLTYVVIKNIDLAEFGNRIPNFEFELEADTSITIGGVLSDLCQEAGITNPSTIALTDTIRGAVVARNSPLTTYIAPIATAYRFNAVQQNGDIRFLKKPESMFGTLELKDMGGRVRTEDKGANGPALFTIQPEFESSSQVTVTGYDVARDYLHNAQTAFRVNSLGGNSSNIDLPFTFNADEIRAISERVLKSTWSKKWGIQFSLTDRFYALAAGYTIGIPINDEVWPFLVTRVTRGRNGVNEVEAIFEDINLEDVEVVGQTAESASQSIISWDSTRLQLMDIPLILTGNDDSGFYWAASGPSGWIGTTLERSSTPDGVYETLNETNSNAAIGDVSGTLGVGSAVTWDRTNTLTVTLVSPETSLSSADELDVLAGANRAWVGTSDGNSGEIIQFMDVVLVGTDTYELSNLLRGRYGTERAIDQHTSGEVFVLLDTGTVGSEEFGISDWYKDWGYRGTAFYSQPELDFLYFFVNTGIRAKPLAPVQPEGVRDTSNNLTVTWIRRTRGTAAYLGNGPVPLNEAYEAYEVDITGPGGTVIRTISSTSATITYTGADQFSDGLTPGQLIDMSIYQISDTRGRGFPLRATV